MACGFQLRWDRILKPDEASDGMPRRHCNRREPRSSGFGEAMPALCVTP
jgi:hypothetical protein